MKNRLLIFFIFLFSGFHSGRSQTIPLAEHPRPDFERPQWINLNGSWQFEFDSMNAGLNEKWYAKKNFSKSIVVPFPWGAALSTVEDKADIGWYKRKIKIPDTWKGKKTFIIIGASDWETDVWLDDKYLGKHRGGYMPFEFDLTDHVQYNADHTLTIRVDDQRRAFTLYGKQGYGNARGIWQTSYLESRGNEYIQTVKCIPDIDKNVVTIKLGIKTSKPLKTPYSVSVSTPNGPIYISDTFPANQVISAKTISIPNARWWSLEDPYLYPITIKYADDEVNSYFGMRKISVVNLPSTEIPYISLNNKPVYLQLTLDQAYHPEGYYTFPTDAFMKEEILRSKSIGLNGIRIHIKPELPRKLYWADKLGLLVMADLPNSWGEPEPQMKEEAETTLRQMIDRDYNHPSIFSWIVFNETWGLTTKVNINGKRDSEYLPETQQWVASMYYLTKSLDPTRLAEDNSICCGRGHTETDIYSWHEYQPGWEWEPVIKKIVDNYYEGSTYHFENGFKQGRQPNINSECGNVWGYEGSTGDVDWSYDYHRMINTFRKYPQISGWLYTEHHDVINEWNGYWRFDRSAKHLGLEKIVPGMSILDFHSKYYISTGNEITINGKANESVRLPLYVSIYDDIAPQTLSIYSELWHMDATGAQTIKYKNDALSFQAAPWMQKQLNSLSFKLPATNGLALVRLYLVNAKGDTLHRNFVHYVIKEGQSTEDKMYVESIPPNQIARSKWSIKEWKAMDGLKVNGAGKGFFEYKLPITQPWKLNEIKESYVIMEISAKELFDKDKDEAFNTNQNYMLGSRVSPSKNPNAYPMTDDKTHTSTVEISVNGVKKKSLQLVDDPADHQGILSWNSQLKDRKLREAGSYGYLVNIPISRSELATAKKNGFLTVKIESIDGGGVAIYGSEFGKYPLDINLVLKKK